MKIICFFTLFAICSANNIKIHNNCQYTVWPAIQGNPDKGQPEGGGFELGAGQTKDINFDNNWQGRVWGRTNCDGNGHCETADCGNKIQCNGAGGVPPATLAEFGFHKDGGVDFYDISLVDGYNLPMRMTPSGGYTKDDNNPKSCASGGCNADLNDNCPAELAIKTGDKTIACQSACEKFNTDKYCCRGAHNTEPTCKSSDWPVDYPAKFKESCPDAYTYAFDDKSSLLTCKGNPDASYDIIFCP